MNLRVNMAEELKLDNLKAVKVLGKGGMGTVFLVQLENNNSHVALKVVDKSSSHHDAPRRARWEMNVLSRLSHSHPFLPSLLGSFHSINYNNPISLKIIQLFFSRFFKHSLIHIHFNHIKARNIFSQLQIIKVTIKWLQPCSKCFLGVPVP